MKVCLTPLTGAVVAQSTYETQMPPGYATNLSLLTRPRRVWRLIQGGSPFATIDLGASPPTIGAVVIGYTNAPQIRLDVSSAISSGYSTLVTHTVGVERLTRVMRGYVAASSSLRYWRVIPLGVPVDADGLYRIGSVAFLAANAIEEYLGDIPEQPMTVLHPRLGVTTGAQGVYQQAPSGYPVRLMTLPATPLPRTNAYVDQLRRLKGQRSGTPIVFYDDRGVPAQVMIGHVDRARQIQRRQTWFSDPLRIMEFT